MLRPPPHHERHRIAGPRPQFRRSRLGHCRPRRHTGRTITDPPQEERPDDRRWLPRSVLSGLPGPSPRSPDDGLPDLHRRTDRHRAGDAGGRHVAVGRPRGLDGPGRGRRAPVLGPAADDPLPAEVPALVVRLEPRAAALFQPRYGLPRADGRPLPVDGRGAVRSPRLPLSRRAARAQPLAAPGQVVPRPSALHRAVLPGHRGVRGGHRRLVRHPPLGALPADSLRLRRGRPSLGQPGYRLRADPRDRRIPALPTQRLTVRNAKQIPTRVVLTLPAAPHTSKFPLRTRTISTLSTSAWLNHVRS